MFPLIMSLNTINIIYGTCLSDIHLLFSQQIILFTDLFEMVISKTLKHIPNSAFAALIQYVISFCLKHGSNYKSHEKK